MWLRRKRRRVSRTAHEPAHCSLAELRGTAGSFLGPPSLSCLHTFISTEPGLCSINANKHQPSPDRHRGGLGCGQLHLPILTLHWAGHPSGPRKGTGPRPSGEGPRDRPPAFPCWADRLPPVPRPCALFPSPTTTLEPVLWPQVPLLGTSAGGAEKVKQCQHGK